MAPQDPEADADLRHEVARLRRENARLRRDNSQLSRTVAESREQQAATGEKLLDGADDDARLTGRPGRLRGTAP